MTVLQCTYITYTIIFTQIKGKFKGNTKNRGCILQIIIHF